MMRCRFLLFTVCAALFFSCANDVPSVIEVRPSVVFDYSDETAAPKMRLAVFAETQSDVRRVAHIRISSKLSGYEWFVENVQIVGSDNRQWAGYANFVCPSSYTIPQGTYAFIYTDAAGENVESAFTVSYPPALVSSNVAVARALLGSDVNERVAVYDENETLIYCDVRKETWSDDDAIFAEMKDAFQIRTCISTRDDSVICLMPVQKQN